MNVSVRQGCTPYSHHALAIVAFPTVRCEASRRDQCVTSYIFGGGGNVGDTTGACVHRCNVMIEQPHAGAGEARRSGLTG